MKPPQRKPVVIAFNVNGDSDADTATQDALRKMAAYQEAEWIAARATTKAAAAIERRLLRGASVEPGR